MKNTDLPFQFVGGSQALDLLNTRIQVEGRLVDLIDDQDSLTSWCACLPKGPSVDGWSKKDVEALFELREVFGRVLRDVTHQEKPGAKDVDVLNAGLAKRTMLERLTPTDTGLALTVSNTVETPQDFLSGLTEEFARLVTENDTKRIKTCAHPECVLVFHDTSKSGRRRWCSMETCGNRSKAATFRSNKS